MDAVTAAFVLLAAIAAGAMNAVVGAGSIITFPTLLAVGVPPVVANVSNTVGLVPGGITAAVAFRSLLVGRGPLVRRLVVASAVGGVCGGALLLVLPPDAFELVVPPLLLVSGLLAAIQPRVAAAVALRRASRPAGAAPAGTATRRPDGHARSPVAGPVLLGAVAVTGVYGGYFGAAQGVILLAVLGILVGGDLRQVNGIKNVLASVANLVSAGLFVAVAEVDWAVAAVVAVGSTIGGALGGRYGRRLPAGPLRVLVVTVAVVAAVWRFLA